MCRGQRYDGGKNMKDIYGGVQKVKRNIKPEVAHNLNLVLNNAVDEAIGMIIFFETFQ